MKLFVSVSLFLLTTSLTVQFQHPPSVANCQAHQRLFLSKVEASYEADADYLPRWEIISQWAAEMEECETADPKDHAAYHDVRAKILAFKSMRQLDFIVRHDLYDQFIEEDKAGKR
jgi:hypothetical protein